ncbi:unnamed protein product, partial [Trichogramma brassicae]
MRDQLPKNGPRSRGVCYSKYRRQCKSNVWWPHTGWLAYRFKTTRHKCRLSSTVCRWTCSTPRRSSSDAIGILI